jgi:hypothetical protein
MRCAIIVACVVLSLCAVQAAWGTPLPADALDRRSLGFEPENNEEKNTTPSYLILHKLQRVYEIPVYMELEFHVQRPDPQRFLDVSHFVIRRNQSLAYTLELLSKETDGLFQHAFIRGQLAIFPVTPADAVSYPEMRADFTADNISTWEAIKRLVMQFNETRPEGPGVEVSRMAMVHWMPPEEFTMAPISVHTKNSTLRETLCAILSASPLWISLQYWHGEPGEPDTLNLMFPEIEHKLNRAVAMQMLSDNPEISEFWIREYEQISEAREPGNTLNEVPAQGAE